MGEPVLVVDYRLTTKTTVDVKEIEGKDDCISYDVDGGLRGKIWIDPGTFEVMRLDQGLAGLVDITLPRRVARRPGVNDRWILERMDTSIRFKPVTFKDPDETLMLPASVVVAPHHARRGNPSPPHLGRVRRLPALPHRRARRPAVTAAAPAADGG